MTRAQAPGAQAPGAPASTARAPAACKDFYTHVNAPWLEQQQRLLTHIIDSSRALPEGTEDTVRVDTLRLDAFTEVGKDVNRTLLGVLEQARMTALTTRDSLTRMLGTYFGSCMATPPRDSAERAKEKDGGAQRCLEAMKSDVSVPLGLAYVRAVLPPGGTRRVLALTEQLRAAMEKRLRANSWMSSPTKTAALAKLAAMRFRVGNPDPGSDYLALKLSPTDYDANRRAVRYVTYQRGLNAMARTANEAAWDFKQYTINAAYMPQKNVLEVPVVLFQPPYFDPNRDAPENYAAMGYVIGHEITHAFDTQGARYDANGHGKNWWAPVDTLPFKQRADKLRAQYDSYTTLDSIPVNGPLTLNENIADLGGFNIAFDAYRASSVGKGNDASANRRFFEAYAVVWRAVNSPERAARNARLDVHAPNQWRVNGVLANISDFAKTYGCSEGDPMVRARSERVEIW